MAFLMLGGALGSSFDLWISAMMGKSHPVMACYGVSAVTGCVRSSNRMSRKKFGLKPVELVSDATGFLFSLTVHGPFVVFSCTVWGCKEHGLAPSGHTSSDFLSVQRVFCSDTTLELSVC